MTIDAVAAVAGTYGPGAPARPEVAAEQLNSVTLGQMIAARLGTSAVTGTLGAMGATPGSIASVGGVSSTGDGTAMPPPAELLAYGNGQIPRDRLSLIGIGQHRLWGPAAQAFIGMRAAAARDGIDLSVTDSYRSYDQQVTLAAQKGLTKNGGWAAVPGTSEHGWGLAVDVDVDPAGLAWLKANGAQFGWVQPAAREPWHWEFQGTPTPA